MRLSTALMDEIDRCTRCGKCRSVCPVFGQTINESVTARGRIRLLEAAAAGQLTVSRQFEVYVSSCLRCLRCESVCPSSIRIDDLMVAAREATVGRRADYRLGRLGLRLMGPHRPVFDLVMRLARRKPAPDPGDGRPTAGLLSLFLIRGVPPLAARSALSRWGGRPLDGSPRIGLFLGCLLNYVYPEVIEAVLMFCRERGIGVVVPEGQLCCGTPALSLGAVDLARRLARRNARVFLAAGVSTVVTACAACGRSMKDVWPRFASRRWGGVRVLDFSQFAAEERGTGGEPVCVRTRTGRRRDLRVTYHDPCHLRFGQGVIEEPRAVLRRSADLVEMEKADACCGSGGLFQVFHPEVSAGIADAKVDAIAACDAPLVATSCPGCMLLLRQALQRRGVYRRVVHVAEVAAGMASGVIRRKPRASRHAARGSTGEPVHASAG